MEGHSEYVLEPLREGLDYTLYRGRARGETAPLLAVAAAAELPAPQSLRRLEHEYALATELDSAWAAQPLTLTRHEGRAVLILRDPGGEPLDRIIERDKGQPIDLARFLRIAIGLAAALRQAHQQGLVHKDVKPANALVDAAGHVWLTGFGLASRLLRERQSPEAPEFIAGSLPYMAPEQTGRMNRSTDSRSDLYSLGATLYEMSTGTLPFTASDPMEWVHCQIARQPVSPRERAPKIPGPVSAIIMKLLSKTAEERYQTAVGLERDLQRCLQQLESHGGIDTFPLGAHDKPDRLLIPEKLYGRASEINTLLASFDRVVNGGRLELVLVSGYSGVGKSSVVNELHRPLVPPRGLFASGKFDQYKRDIPYATLAQAFQSLVRPILAMNEQELERWRDALREALGANGQLMVDLVPELKLIIGEQPRVPELPPQDAQRRSELVFRRFIGAFTQQRPLALFLDDLQWLDAATLDLMAHLLTHPDVKNLLLIGAYRDNEVTPAHPLMRKLQAMRQAGAIVHDIVLAPLTRDDLEELIADSLHCERARAEPLAELVAQKTTGNPFFAIQFFSALAEESLLTFDHDEGQWSWDLNRIRAKGYTDNVVDLVVEKLGRLPIVTQQALQQLACLGNSADFAMLRMVYHVSREAMHEQFWDAVRTGLIFRSENAYRFLHDRVHEAAYSLIPQELRAETHLRIGMLMVSRISADKLEEGIFEIVNQLNRGAHLVTSITQRERIAELNLIAGRRAKASTAYASALKYLHAGRRLLTDETWNRNHDLVFSIEHLLAACEVLTADMAGAENRLCSLAERAGSAKDSTAVTRLRLTLYDLMGRSDRGVEVFIEYQRSRGKEWSPHPAYDEVKREYDRIMALMDARKVEELIDLPLITNQEVLDVLDILTEVVMTSLNTDENLHALVLCRMVSLTLEHGNSDASCFAYVTLAMLAGPQFGNYAAGFQLGKLGYDLVEKRGLQRYQARVYLRFGNCVMPWRQHVKTGREFVLRAFDAANRMGDLTFAAYGCYHLITNLLATGDNLAEVQREAETGLAFATKARFGIVIDILTAQLALIRTLRGLTTKFGSFGDGYFDALPFERHLSENPALALPECRYWIRKLQACFAADDYASAIHASVNAERLLWTSHSFFEVAEYQFYGALARAGAFDSAPEGARQEHFAALANHHRQLTIWAANCPENFENRAALAGAEIARIEGRDMDAMRLYEQAIHSAHENGFVQNEAVANELAGRFYLGRGIETAGYAYLRDARSCYARWGAHGKVKQLDALYPRLREERPTASWATIDPSVGQLDVETVVKASQALSSEMVLPKLIDRLMRIAVEQAGADRGLLILPRQNDYRIEAEALADGEGTVLHAGALDDPTYPETIIRYAIRTQERVILDDAAKPHLFSADPYLGLRQPRSILCLPLVRQGSLCGLLYLENTLAPRVFTPERARLLELLASQAAISLENTLLFDDLQTRERELRETVAQLTEGQKLNKTGSFTSDIQPDQQRWSEELYRVYEIDPATPPSMEAVRARIHPDDLELFNAEIQRRMDGLESDFAFRIVTPKSGVKHLRGVARLMEYVAGRPIFMGIVQDITESKLAEEALNQARSELAHVARVATLNAMTASIAHEVSQPLSGILLNANACVRLLAADPPDLAVIAETARRTIRDANRASEVIKRLRAMFSAKTATMEVADLNEVAREVIALSKGELQRSGALLQTDFADDLPHVSIDRVQLQQVILNLLLNAAEAMAGVEDRPRRILVQTGLHGDGGVQLDVRDRGIGLDPAAVKKLFDAFYTTKTQGMGVGLSISRSIIERHNGRLWAEANAGPGATFSFCIPSALHDHVAALDATTE